MYNKQNFQHTQSININANISNSIHSQHNRLVAANLTGPLENQFNDFSDEDCNLEEDDENIDEN